MNIKRIITILLIWAIFLGGVAYATEPEKELALKNPFNALTDELLAYFKPLAGNVVSVDGKIVVSDISASSGARTGMRLTVFKEGEPFRHPITKEIIGKTEVPTGIAEVIDTTSSSAKLLLLDGVVLKGNTLRLSSSKVKTLFVNAKGVSWGFSEEYRDSIGETARFELLDSPVQPTDEKAVKSEAQRLGADIILALFEEPVDDGALLRQKILWPDDMKALFLQEVKIASDYAKELKFGEEHFTPKKEELIQVYDMPFKVNSLCLCDVDGNGEKEFVLDTGDKVVFYKKGKTLKAEFGGLEIKGSWADEQLWLQCFDMDGDKKEEVILTVMRNENVISYIYKFNNNGFDKTNSLTHFVRASSDSVYGQNYLLSGGFYGPVFRLDPTLKKEDMKLPAGVNVFDFVELESKQAKGVFVLAYDNIGYLNLFEPVKGSQVWRSKENYGGFVRAYKKVSFSTSETQEEWYIKDRMLAKGDSVFLMKKLLVSETAKGIGYKQSMIMRLDLMGSSMSERIVVEYIPGTVLDFAMDEDNIYALTSEVKLTNIFKGLGIMGSKIYTFPRRDTGK